MRLLRLEEPTDYLDVQYEKSEMREQFLQNFEGKNIEIFACCEVTIVYRARDECAWLHIRTDR